MTVMIVDVAAASWKALAEGIDKLSGRASEAVERTQLYAGGMTVITLAI